MKCPIDGETLVMTERHGVEIDYCPKCRGVWLDRGELDKIIDKAAGAMALPDPEPEPVAPPPPEREPAPQPQVWQEPYGGDRIPHEQKPERDEKYSRGRRYPDDDDYRFRKRKKRKSILSEIFDFD
ncbi:TFIIB-type zinc ribbon-containing protein [Marimonas arenosa]|uniref:Zf-TFIIB domain-containing protein n=1 Tax=Marimonas arenosa TaxID=1795305 RepID=A0AAE3WE98_9RHOB|nr:zf-TFIIB domain-containing protein [Marimonas arenosa]MDQ2091666.1 zf-TFIIB domain-containing protein [Marimonas arenosa]